MTGTVINVITVLIGGILGTLLGHRLPERMRETVMHGLGLATLAIGIQLALSQLTVAEASLKRLTFIVVLASILLGGLAGEALRLDERLEASGEWLQKHVAHFAPSPTTTSDGKPDVSTFSQGFVTASLVFCAGPLTLIGSIRDGLTGDYTLLAIKSVLDGFTAFAFASSLGVGVTFAALTVLIYQGGLALGSQWLSAILSDVMIAEMSATGGILLLGIGFILLDMKRIRVANLLPAIFIAPVLVALALPLVPLFG